MLYVPDVNFGVVGAGKQDGGGWVEGEGSGGGTVGRDCV